MSAFPALGLDVGPHAEDGRGSEAGEEGLACTTATEPRAGLVNAGLGCRAPGGQARCLGPAGWGPGSRARSRHRSRRALAGGSQAGEHMPATAGSSCPPPRELAQPVAIYVLEAGDMLPAKGPRGGRWRCVGLATSAATGCQSRPPPARPGHGCSQAWLLPRSRGNACGPRAGLPHVHCRQKVASRGWGTGSPGGWASRRAAPEPGGEAGCAKVGTDMANSSHPLGAPCTS